MLRSQAGVLPDFVLRHPGKPDPVRSRALNEALLGALAQAREIIADGGSAPVGAQYLNMARLMRDLDPARVRRQLRFGPVIRALRFLDF